MIKYNILSQKLIDGKPSGTVNLTFEVDDKGIVHLTEGFNIIKVSSNKKNKK
jgi:hypothetical protein